MMRYSFVIFSFLFSSIIFSSPSIKPDLKTTCVLLKKATDSWQGSHYKKTLKLLKKAASSNLAQAQDALANLYANNGSAVFIGDNGKPFYDFPNALQWYKKAIAQNYAPAYSDLGYIYITKLNKQKLGRKYIIKAAKMGLMDAIDMVSRSYDFGNYSFEQNNKLAYAWTQVYKSNTPRSDLYQYFSDETDKLNNRMSFFQRLSAHHLATIFVKKYGNKPNADEKWYPCGDVNNS